MHTSNVAVQSRELELRVYYIVSLFHKNSRFQKTNSSKQIHDEVGPTKFEYPTHDKLGFLKSNASLR